MKFQIQIHELVSEGTVIIIPVLPEEIKFLSGGTRFVTYNILDKGEVKKPVGENLRKVKWNSILPGENHYLPYQSVSRALKPDEYQSIFSKWKSYGTPLRLSIIGTPIHHKMYLSDYNVTYKGAFGDYDYDIEFTDNRDITVSLVEDKTEKQPERATEETKTYTIVKGDTLWDISKRFLGSGTRWNEIYNLNKEAIENTAKKYGKKSSNNGHWIYPGTKLHIPS